MVSLVFHIPILDHTAPQYWYDLLKALSNTVDYLNRVAAGNDYEDVILAAADYIEFEIERIIGRVTGSSVQIPSDLKPTILIEEFGETIELSLEQFSNLHSQAGDESHIN